jgi:hypothetical protein
VEDFGVAVGYLQQYRSEEMLAAAVILLGVYRLQGGQTHAYSIQLTAENSESAIVATTALI